MVYYKSMNKRTKALALITGALFAIGTLAGAPSAHATAQPASAAYVTVTDWTGEGTMILNQTCATVVREYLNSGQGNTLREMLSDGTTASNAYLAACK